MGKPETDLAPRIREKTLELLMQKEPEEISTRDIAKACGVTATSIYYYYKDREALFNEIKLGCIEKIDREIMQSVEKGVSGQRGHNKESDPLMRVRSGLRAFRDWAFSNPRIALLVMGRIKADTRKDPEKMRKYYTGTVFAKGLLDEAVQKGDVRSADTLRDAGLCIAALWGAIESVLLNRALPQYWSKRGGVVFTDAMIDLLLASLTRKID